MRRGRRWNNHYKIRHLKKHGHKNRHLKTLARQVKHIMQMDSEHKFTIQPQGNNTPPQIQTVTAGNANMTNVAGAGLLNVIMNNVQGTSQNARLGNKVHLLTAKIKANCFFTSATLDAAASDGGAVYIHECYATKGQGPGENATILKGNIGTFLYPGGVFSAGSFQALGFKKPIFDANLAGFWIKKTTVFKPPYVMEVAGGDRVCTRLAATPYRWQTAIKNKQLIYGSNGDSTPENIACMILIINISQQAFQFQYGTFTSFTDD